MVDFSAGPSALSEVAKFSVVERYSELFWQRSPSAEEKTNLIATLDQTIGTLPGDVESTAKIFGPICISVITSLSFLTN